MNLFIKTIARVSNNQAQKDAVFHKNLHQLKIILNRIIDKLVPENFAK